MSGGSACGPTREVQVTGVGREQTFLITASAMLLAAVAGSFALYWTSSLMVPFVLSILVYYILAPIVDALQGRMGAPRWLAMVAAVVAIVIGGTLMTLLLWSSARGVSDHFDLYTERISELGHQILSVTDYLPEGTVPEEWTAEEIDVEELLKNIDASAILPSIGTTIGTNASNLISFLSNLVANALLVALFSVYLLAGRAPNHARTGIWAEIDEKIRSYLFAKFLTSGLTGVMTWVILAALGLDLALVFGVLAFLLNFIPSIGSIVAMLLPIPMALVQFDSFSYAALVVILPGIVQFTIGNVLEPKVMGDSLGLHPITILITLLFWGLLWGPVGMLLATPITAVLTIVLSRFESTRAIAQLAKGDLQGLFELIDEAESNGTVA